MQNSKMDDYRLLINNALNERLPEECGIVGKAMKYSIENGGKRIRPLLTFEFCRICGGKTENAVDFACAIEMIHTYSLIHDDLPCMDNDYMRRGKPSCHIKFGEEYALLAGDALLTLAFKTVMQCEGISADNRIKACSVLADAAGCKGMIGGQMLDLLNEGGIIDVDTLRKTDELKTGAMIEAAALLGCIAADANQKQINAAREFTQKIGLAFQIVDDILDVTSDETTLGKPVGSDKVNQKCTYVSLLGLERARVIAKELTDKAKSALDIFDYEADFLRELADILASRRS